MSAVQRKGVGLKPDARGALCGCYSNPLGSVLQLGPVQGLTDPSWDVDVHLSTRAGQADFKRQAVVQHSVGHKAQAHWGRLVQPWLRHQHAR